MKQWLSAWSCTADDTDSGQHIRIRLNLELPSWTRFRVYLYLSHFEYFLKSTGLNLYLHGWLSVSASVCMYHHLPINKSLHILNYNTLFISAKQLQKPLNKLFKSDTWLTRHFYRIQLQWLTLPAQHHPIPDLWREQNWSWSSLYRLAYQLHNFSWLIVKCQHFLWNLYFY